MLDDDMMDTQDEMDAIDAEVEAAIPKPVRTMAPFKWFGGKGNAVSRIVPLIPYTKVYCEPYAGAASVFWRLERRPVEVLNDLDGRIVNLFRVLQDPVTFREFRHRVLWTPYAREEFVRALTILQSGPLEGVEAAWAFYVAQNQGFSGGRTCNGSWGRTFASSQDAALTASATRARIASLQFWHDRLTRVQIDCVDALQCIRYWDTPDTSFYIDPPYHPGTRTERNYVVDQDGGHHERLVQVLLGLKGSAVLSCYWHEVYRPLLESGWSRVDCATSCFAAARTRGSNLRGKGAVTSRVPRIETLLIRNSKGGPLL